MMNQVLEAFRSWDERQQRIGQIGPAKEDQKIIGRLKLSHFRECRHRLSKAISADEKPFVPLLDNAIKRLEKELYPNIVSRLLSRLKDRLIERPAYMRRMDQQRQENISLIRRQLDKAGLGGFSADLQKQLQSGQPINLSCQLDQQRSLKVELHFAKDADENYQFKRIDAAIGNSRHQFKLDEWPGLDMVRVKNLLEGRAIKQDYTDLTGKRNSRWLELAPDGQVRQYLSSYGFDPAKSLEAIPFYDKRGLIQELEKGNKVQLPNGSLQADPATASISAFDKDNKKVSLEHFNEPKEKQAVIKQLPHRAEPKKQARVKM